MSIQIIHNYVKMRFYINNNTLELTSCTVYKSNAASVSSAGEDGDISPARFSLNYLAFHDVLYEAWWILKVLFEGYSFLNKSAEN